MADRIAQLVTAHYIVKTPGTDNPENRKICGRLLRDLGCTEFQFDQTYEVARDEMVLMAHGYRFQAL